MLTFLFPIYFVWRFCFAAYTNDLLGLTAAQIEFTRHSSETTLEANLNNFYIRIPENQLPEAPIVTFLMNDFTFHSKSDGWIKSNISSYIDALMTNNLGIGHGLRRSTRARNKRWGPTRLFL